MSDSRQMERKLNMPAPKSLQANSKTDAKKPTDQSNSKHSNRRNGKVLTIQPHRTDANQNISLKKNSNNNKQPLSRASLFCRKKSSEVTDSLNDAEDDIMPLLRHRDNTRTWNMRNSYGSRKKELPQKFNVKHFLIANCQFVVKRGNDYSQWLLNQDEIVNWDCIEQIKMFSTQSINCPICMDIPITPKMTCCGHIYCWPCILRYLDVNEELDIAGCPICHSRILKKELQSVEIIIKEECCVGQPITLQLMKRARNSLQVYSISELRQNMYLPSDNAPLSVNESNFSTAYSRLLIGDTNQILNILNKERESLVLLLDSWETEDIEKKYIFEALELLSTREDLLMNKEPNLEMNEIDLESMNSTHSTSLGSPLLSSLLEVPGCSYNNISSVLDENSSVQVSQMKEINTNGDKLNPTDIRNMPAKKDFYFYQAIDGQHIYLSAVNVEMLECMFGSLENSPQQIKSIVIEKQYLSMTESLRKRYRFLLHLPITTVFEWVELDLTNIVNSETLFIFKSNLDERKAIRDRRARDEQRLAKRIEERNTKKLLPPAPKWHDKNLFPECGYDPFSDKSMVPLSESIRITSTLDQTLVNTSYGSPNSLSFAKALQNEIASTNSPSNSNAVSTNGPSQWPVLGSRPNSLSMNNMLEDAVANINLHDDHNKSKNKKKKKRSKYEPIF